MGLKALLLIIPLAVAFMDLLITENFAGITEAFFWTAIGTLILGGVVGGIHILGSGESDTSILAIMVLGASTIFYLNLLAPSYADFQKMPGGSILTIVLMVMYSFGTVLLAVGSD